MQVTYNLSKQTAVVTGGARGIGRAIATLLVESGAERVDNSGPTLDAA